ncbi:MAG: LysM peptidoglycan-binding domain-containing protein [Solirubrobacteraceae bacterium]
MVGKSARFLAPIALAAVGVGVYLIVHSTLAHHGTTVVQHSSTTPTGRRHTVRRHRRQPKYYIVKSGDTLSAISSKTGVPVARLTSLNPALSAAPNSLQTGQRLRLH